MKDLSHTYAIETQELHKSYNYGRIKAVHNLSLQVVTGSLFGLIGADGAGKTSLIKILATLYKPDHGKAFLFGMDTQKKFRTLRHYIGYMPGKFSLYSDLSVEENIKVFATLYGTTIQENYSLYGDIYDQLAPFAKRPAGKLSGGMKQKLALCCALVHRPSILLLDEPTTGVDPVSRHIFWNILHRLKEEEGLSIFVSTPYMDEAFRCDRIALMHEGNIVSEGTPQNLIDLYPYELWSARGENKGQLLKVLKKLQGVTSAYSFGESIHFTFDNQQTSQNRLLAELEKQGVLSPGITRISPSIEDYFLATIEEKNHDTCQDHEA